MSSEGPEYEKFKRGFELLFPEAWSVCKNAPGAVMRHYINSRLGTNVGNGKINDVCRVWNEALGKIAIDRGVSLD